MTNGIGDCYLNHFERFLGTPVDRSVFVQQEGSPAIQILHYDRVFPSCRVFASLGFSHFADIVGNTAEVVLPVDDGWLEVPGLLANALFQIVDEALAFGRGISIRGVDRLNRSFSEEFGKTAIYFTLPFCFPPGSDIVRCASTTARLYLALFISEAEDAYFRANGAEQFEALLESSKVDTLSLRRASCL